MASVSLDYSEYELLKDALEEKTRKIKSLEDIQRVVIKHTDFKIFKEQLADFIENAKRWNNNHAVLELIKTDFMSKDREIQKDEYVNFDDIKEEVRQAYKESFDNKEKELNDSIKEYKEERENVRNEIEERNKKYFDNYENKIKEANNNLKDLSDKCTKLKEENNKLTIGLTYYRLPWYRKIFKRKPKL